MLENKADVQNKILKYLGLHVVAGQICESCQNKLVTIGKKVTELLDIYNCNECKRVKRCMKSALLDTEQDLISASKKHDVRCTEQQLPSSSLSADEDGFSVLLEDVNEAVNYSGQLRDIADKPVCDLTVQVSQAVNDCTTENDLTTLPFACKRTQLHE